MPTARERVTTMVVAGNVPLEFRIRAIHTNEFDCIFKALKSQSALTSINPKLVRALAARTMKLIRHDIPWKASQKGGPPLNRFD
ncbi:hypothetical protein [Rhizobium sp. BK538]|uniref:hypothetical protein n=1 Tax=Rhizobium sp. BK538 TaxID=2586984 RepID=UPI001791F964|nr:hypothetical protein [Rhizobium sp. BK538]MBB4169752.1 hypothetical protein [Rhizobium sp. BK538]